MFVKVNVFSCWCFPFRPNGLTHKANNMHVHTSTHTCMHTVVNIFTHIRTCTVTMRAHTLPFLTDICCTLSPFCTAVVRKWAWKRECVHCVNKLCKTFFFQNSIRILQQCAVLHDQEQEGCWPRLPATLSWILNLSASDHQVPNLETVCSVKVPGNIVSSWILWPLQPHRVTSGQSQEYNVIILNSDSTQHVCGDI